MAATAASTAVPDSNSRPVAPILAGLFSGVTVAGVFNPWDRALYLSVKYKRDFLDKKNWKRPYEGFWQALVIRTLSGGLYFPLFDIFHPPIRKMLDGPDPSRPQRHQLLEAFLAGNAAGATSGVILNCLTAVKYHTWNRHVGFLSAAKQMWATAGLAPFLRGTGVTVLRDCIFGGAFAASKYIISTSLKRPDDSPARAHGIAFFASLISGGLGTAVSSPINFVRTMVFATPAPQPVPKTWPTLKDLWRECRENPRPWAYLQERLRIGWGTLRVGVGMAVGYELYNWAKPLLEQRLGENGHGQSGTATPATTTTVAVLGGRIPQHKVEQQGRGT